LVRVGTLLSRLAPDGRRYAEWIAKGRSMALTQADFGLPLQNGTAISLDTMNEWGCPYCGSAHGSGKHPSGWISARNLAKNVFYYNPETCRVFTISKTCLDEYALSGRLIDLNDQQPESAFDGTPYVPAATRSTPNPLVRSRALGKAIGVTLAHLRSGLFGLRRAVG